MEIIWSPDAQADLVAIHELIARDNTAAAAATINRIINAAETYLPQQPEIGRAGRVHGTRELVIPQSPYILPYRIVGSQLAIIRVYHAARQWPEPL